MSQLNVDAIRASNGTGDAISLTASDKTCTANITNNLSNRNLIINGAMQVWQRGTSTTTSAAYQADRFWVVNQGTYARDNSAPDGFQYSAKLTHSSSDMAIGTPLELPATGNAAPLVATNKFTVSFYGKANSGTEDVNLLCRYRNSKFSGTNQVDFTGTGQTFTLTTSWQRFTKTFTIPTVNANNTIISIEVEGIGATAYFTGFQAELGEVATDFEHRSYGEELARCQRYYYRITPAANDDVLTGAAWTPFQNVGQGITEFPVTMRTRVTALEQSGSATDYQISYHSSGATCSVVPTFQHGGTNGAATSFTVAGTPWSQGDSVRPSNKTTDGFLAWSAEL